ncbi:hypothetical protein CCHR01_07695 [Colletotrichum chrysophilum]|uniref:Uncharacterized protein n=1 Tax=Colletotrichum chrysophilum TaxID=1836956 RepID=A0AAD9AN28_9PEZI|nr:hypothetical protein CCHR01_07695 [Colletotrichum chrysophilum]
MNPVRTWLRWEDPSGLLDRECHSGAGRRQLHNIGERCRPAIKGGDLQRAHSACKMATSCMRRQAHLNHHTPLKQKRRDDLRRAMPAYFSSCLPAPDSNNMKPPSHDDDNSHALPLQITNIRHVHPTRHQGPQAPQHPNTLQTSPSTPRADDQSWTNPTGPSNASPQAPSPTIPPPGPRSQPLSDRSSPPLNMSSSALFAP